MAYPASKTLDEEDRLALADLAAGKLVAPLFRTYADPAEASRKRYALYRAWRHFDSPKILRIRLSAATLTISTMDPNQ